jgi:hypothetical protein
MALVGRGIGRYYGGSSASVVYVGSDSADRPIDVAYSSNLTLDDYPVVRGEIPAGDRGIDALQRQGKLRLVTAADVARWAGDSAQQSRLASGLGIGSVYVVLDEITLPPGLFGAHRRDFIVPSGVPKPKGPKWAPSPAAAAIVGGDGATAPDRQRRRRPARSRLARGRRSAPRPRCPAGCRSCHCPPGRTPGIRPAAALRPR